MKAGDLVRCKVTKAPNTIGIVISTEEEKSGGKRIGGMVVVLTGDRHHRWAAHRLEVVNECG